MTLSVNETLSELQGQLEREPNLDSYGFHVSQGELVNENPSLTPWLGIYTKKVTHDPLTLGATQRRWKGKIELLLVVQATSLRSGNDCTRLLEKYITSTIDAVINDTTFGNSIDMVNKLDVDYSYKNTESETLYFQEAYIALEAETEHE